MLKILLLTILLVWVYSWEQFKYALLNFTLKILKLKTRHSYNNALDQIIGNAVFLAMIPIGFAHYSLNTDNFGKSLVTLAIYLSIMYLGSEGIKLFVRRLRMLETNDSMSDRLILVGYSLLGLFSPAFRSMGITNIISTKIISLLNIAILGSLTLLFIISNTVPEMLQDGMKQLVMVLTALLFLRITIPFLEQHLQLGNFSFSAYLRTLAGIGISLILIYN